MFVHKNIERLFAFFCANISGKNETLPYAKLKFGGCFLLKNTNSPKTI